MIAKQSSIGSSARRSEASQRYMESTMADDHGTDKVDMFDQVDIDSTKFDNNLDNSFGNLHATSNHVQAYVSEQDGTDIMNGLFTTLRNHMPMGMLYQIMCRFWNVYFKNVESKFANVLILSFIITAIMFC
uniref:Uncharacterized protein n=1 Tax=Oryza meridionalis TaxID=40149 RepID=A0A0E0F9X5_9ORYZ